MNAQQRTEREALRVRILTLIAESADGTRRDRTRDALLSDLYDYQTRWVVPYGNFCANYPRMGGPAELPARALPCDAFRFARISSRAAEEDVRLFRSSGTTQDARSEHAFADLTVYDAAAEAAARSMLFPDRARMQLLILAPSETELPDSSLSYMLARFHAWFGSASSQHIWPIAATSIGRLSEAIARAQRAAEPLALLGTSFAFVHALDALAGHKLPLPPHSRIMQTGGFKGRARELSPLAMRQSLTECFEVPDAAIVAEYGMTELSSQLYETSLRASLLSFRPCARRLWAPAWVRVSVVDPEHLTPLPEGQQGLVRIDDAANLDSVCALQTADLGVIEAGELVLQGRAQGAVARGCSITADQLLSGRQP
jgi:acyl-CoA synthetase (AMP-forming)/AMP-acid ligase II